MRKLTVMRFELHPNAVNPEGMAVAFLAETHGRKDYKDTLVPIEQCIDPETWETLPAETIVMLARKQIHVELRAMYEAMESKPAIIGMEISPDDLDGVEEPEFDGNQEPENLGGAEQ